MATTFRISFVLALLLGFAPLAIAQDDTGDEDNADTTTIAGEIEQAGETVKQKTTDIAKSVDENEAAKEVSSGILAPIYSLAEYASHPAFHWVAFAAMVAGVVSFALQLTLGKLVVLSRMGFSLSEILSDALGLFVSLVGLVLTTQAATENSTFTTSAAAVLSAAIVGTIIGIMFYVTGQSQELQAVKGRKLAAAERMAEKK